METKYKILVAEDHEDTSQVIKEFLIMDNFDVICVSTGKDAITACEKDADISLILMDGGMPDMDGFEATKAIKKFRPALPIICITSNERILPSYEEYFVAHFRKPFPSFKQLAPLIKETLQTKTQ